MVEPNLTAPVGVWYAAAASAEGPQPPGANEASALRVCGERGYRPALSLAHTSEVRCSGGDAHRTCGAGCCPTRASDCVVELSQRLPHTPTDLPLVAQHSVPHMTENEGAHVCSVRFGNMYAASPAVCGVFVHRQSAGMRGIHRKPSDAASPCLLA